jgi:hypothetical protein
MRTYAMWGMADEMQADWREELMGTLRIGTGIGAPPPHIVWEGPSTSSPGAARARISASPEGEQDSSTGNDQASSSRWPESSALFDPDGFSGRTFQAPSLAKAVGTSESCLERWPTSGTAWAGGFSTAVSSECRSDADGCSSSEPSLTEILEPPLSVPARYLLSARAAQGILRRAEKRGRTLPTHLEAALAAVAA